MEDHKRPAKPVVISIASARAVHIVVGLLRRVIVGALGSPCASTNAAVPTGFKVSMVVPRNPFEPGTQHCLRVLLKTPQAVVDVTVASSDICLL